MVSCHLRICRRDIPFQIVCSVDVFCTLYLQTAEPAPFTSQTVLIPQGEGVQGDWGATLAAKMETAAKRESKPCSMVRLIRPGAKPALLETERVR